MLEESGQPRNVTEVVLAGPGPGAVLVRPAARGVRHEGVDLMHDQDGTRSVIAPG
jgi:Zn-dependent alcohol dehydrogenase